MHVMLRWAMQPTMRRRINLAFALWYSALALGALLALGDVFGPFPRLPALPAEASCASWFDGLLVAVILTLACAAIAGMLVLFWTDYRRDRRTLLRRTS